MKARGASLDILDDARSKNRRLGDIRDEYFSKYDFSPEDKRRITSLIQDTTRWQGRIDYWLSASYNKKLKSLQPRLLILLRLATCELLIDRSNPEYAVIHTYVNLAAKRVGGRVKGLVNAVLRKVSVIDPSKGPEDSSDLTIRANWNSFPRWIYEKRIQYYGVEKANELCLHQNSQSGFSIRRNLNKITPEKLTESLAESGITIFPAGDANNIFFTVTEGRSLLIKHELFRNGSVSIQDRAAGAAVDILDPKAREVILDVCAAPGTKSVYIAERIGKDTESNIFSYDSDSARVAKAVEDVNRHGWKNISWGVADATVYEFPEADAILVDAPCTGTGVIGRRPDIRWRRTASQVGEMADLQLRILNNVSRYLKPGGRLVYSTCSLEPEENWNVVDSFLKFNTRFYLENINGLVPEEWITEKNCMETYPPRDGVDGIFAARLGLK